MISHAHKQFLFAVLVGFALAALVHSQNQSGFISIDCGLPNNSSYTETTTGINYISDSTFIDTGESKYLSANHDLNYYQPYWYVRSFPQGVRNCYRINVTYGTKYLVRAGFQYGNYGENKPPEFELHLGANFERMEIESIVDSRVQGTYKYFSAQKAIETALACVSKTSTERPEISHVYDRLKECFEIEKVSEELEIGSGDEGRLITQIRDCLEMNSQVQSKRLTV